MHVRAPPSLLLEEPINQAELKSRVQPLRNLVRPLKRKVPVSNLLLEVRIPLAEQRKEAQHLQSRLPPREPPISPWAVVRKLNLRTSPPNSGLKKRHFYPGSFLFSPN
jgi:hypothetical protein